MKLLIVTQAVDSENPVLGFFVRWIEEFSKQYEHIEVVCLEEGKYVFPPNVSVHSLGRERGVPTGRVVYALRFLVLVWQLRSNYEAVFVHMNQEYVLISGWLWKLLGKRVYLWRNHYAGSLFTDITAAFCTKVFCTSKHSYTAKYAKTILMPVGVDAERFSSDTHIVRNPQSILYLGRISPSKRPEILIDALALLEKDGSNFSASFYGSPLPTDETYYAKLKEKANALNSHNLVSFYPGIPNIKTPDVYRAHSIFVNLSPSGMLDKTIFEAIGCGCLPLYASGDMGEIAGPEFAYADGDVQDLAKQLSKILALSEEERAAHVQQLQKKVMDTHSLTVLNRRLYQEIKA